MKKKIVLISGSSKGIGNVIARTFLKNGDKVLINGTNKLNLYKAYKKLSNQFNKSNVMAIEGDISSLKTLKKIKMQVIKKWGAIDVIIANAGRIKVNEKTLNNKDMFRSNFFPAYKFVNFFLSDLKKSKSSSIVFISSIAAITKTTANKGFIKAKFEINKFAKRLSLKLAKKNININVLAPGNIYIKNGNWYQKMKSNKKKVLEYIKNNVPMQRFGYPEEVANLCIFLTSSNSKFITGQIIAVDGGQSLKNEFR
jgi:3-oxoacyl-[acyl-carrier protein] reductase